MTAVNNVSELPWLHHEHQTAEMLRAADVAEAHLDGIAKEVTQHLAEHVPGYAIYSGTVDENRWVVSLLLRGLRGMSGYGVKERELIHQRVHRWARDASLDVLTEAVHVALRCIARTIGDLAGLDKPAMVALQDCAWEFAMSCGTAIAEVQRDLAVAAAQQDLARRGEFLRDLALGRVAAARLAVEAVAYGVDTEHDYYAVRAQGDHRHLATLETHLRHAGGTRALHALSLVSDGELIALTPRRPGAPSWATVSVSGPCRLSEIHRAFDEAREVLEAAQAFGITGTVDLLAVGPLTLVTVGDHRARRLAQHYLAGRHEGFAEIEETVRILLDNDLGIDETASRMHLHRNTVRYRVQRFRELTGLDVRRSRDLVTIWWLLNWRALYQHSAVRPEGNSVSR